MRNSLFLLVMTGFIIAFTGCNKDDNNNGNNNATDSPSVINFSLPGSGAIYPNGTPLRVEGDMTDTDGLSNARVEIRNKTTGTIYFQQSNSTGGVSFFRFGFSWTVTGISATTTAVVKVTATDRNSKQVSKEVEVQLDN